MAHQDANDSILFLFDDPITSENKGDVPNLISENDKSVNSMPPNEGGASVHKAFTNIEIIAHRRTDRIRENQQESNKTFPSPAYLDHKLSDHSSFMSSIQNNETMS